MGAEGAGSVAPGRILLLPEQETITVFAKTDITIPNPEGGGPLTVTVRPEQSGGVWVEVDGNYSDDAPTIAPLREKPLTARTRQGEPFIVHSPDGDPARLSWLSALIMEVAFPTGAGLTRLFAGFVPCKRSVGL